MALQLTQVSFTGPALDQKSPLLKRLPADLAELLEQVNGFVQFGGGLHLRGICANPPWHDLERVLSGPKALYLRYQALGPDDIPFAQDCVADQFFLRLGEVWKLWAETGGVECLEVDLMEFLAQAKADPVGFLKMQPLLQFRRRGKDMRPGQVLHVFPPLCAAAPGDPLELQAMECDEALQFLAGFSQHLSAR